MKQLVFVHGRSQEFKNAVDLKAEWVSSLEEGLKKSNLKLPIPDSQIRFPYYGQTLYDLVHGVPDDKVAEVIVRGDGASSEETQFVRDYILELQRRFDISEDELRETGGVEVIEKGPLNWGWVRSILKVLDRRVPKASGASVALFTKDVYMYLRNPGFQDKVDAGIRSAITPGVETVVVGHSLGAVASYRVLRRDGKGLGWNVPQYITVGAPLAVTVIRSALAPNKHPDCVGKWFNAMDSRDVVALYPLDATNFPVNPAIENKTDVDNPTTNRHGISGYLSDPTVARRIHEALVA